MLNGKYSWQAVCQCNGNPDGRNYGGGGYTRLLGDPSTMRKYITVSGFSSVAYRKLKGR
jgi:hypothetical protein